jgi:hypothetical protein
VLPSSTCDRGPRGPRTSSRSGVRAVVAGDGARPASRHHRTAATTATTAAPTSKSARRRRAGLAIRRQCSDTGASGAIEFLPPGEGGRRPSRPRATRRRGSARCGAPRRDAAEPARDEPGDDVEVPPGFEPGNGGFADHCLTAWLWHPDPPQRAGESCLPPGPRRSQPGRGGLAAGASIGHGSSALHYTAATIQYVENTRKGWIDPGRASTVCLEEPAFHQPRLRGEKAP